MKTSNISKEKASLLIAHSILWGSAMIASSIVLRGDDHASMILLLLAFLYFMSLLIDACAPAAKKIKDDHAA